MFPDSKKLFRRMRYQFWAVVVLIVAHILVMAYTDPLFTSTPLTQVIVFRCVWVWRMATQRRMLLACLRCGALALPWAKGGGDFVRASGGWGSWGGGSRGPVRLGWWAGVGGQGVCALPASGQPGAGRRGVEAGGRRLASSPPPFSPRAHVHTSPPGASGRMKQTLHPKPRHAFVTTHPPFPPLPAVPSWASWWRHQNPAPRPPPLATSPLPPPAPPCSAQLGLLVAIAMAFFLLTSQTLYIQLGR